MAVETAIHRWDVEDAIGGTGNANPIDADLAAEGIEEDLTLMAPRLLAGRDGIDIGGSLHLHCADADGEWRRIPPDDPSLEILGDRDVFDRWLALPVPQ